jgi:hypothetical protein
VDRLLRDDLRLVRLGRSHYVLLRAFISTDIK